MASPAVNRILRTPIARVLFDLPLTTTLVPLRSMGASTPTFTRATTATVYGYAADAVAGASLTLLTVASGEARFQGARRVSEGVWSNVLADGTAIPDATLDGYLAEGARTNLLAYSQELDNAAWTKTTATVTANAVAAPDGTTTADKLIENGGVAEARQNKSATGAVTASVSLKAAERTKAVVYLDDGAGYSIAYSVDLNTGVATATRTPAGIWSAVSCSVDALPSGWYRAKVSGTTTAALVGIRVLPDGGTTYDGFGMPTHTAVTGNGIYLWGGQLEAAFASSYIPTTSTSVTRNASVESNVTAGNIKSAAGTLYLEFKPSHAPSGTIYLWGSYVDANNSTALLHDGTNLIFRKRIAGTNYDATIALTFASGTRYKAAGRWGPFGVDVFLGGVKGTGNANASSAQIAATMQLGADGNSAGQPFAAIRNDRAYSRAVPDATLLSMTT